MRLLLKTIIFLLISLPLLLTAVVIAVSDRTPLVKSTPQVTPEVAREIKRKAREMQFAIYYLPIHTITFSEDEITKLLAVLARAIPRLRGDARITQQGSEIRATLELPENPFGSYINLRLGLPIVSQGLVIDHLTIGSLSLKGKHSYALIETLANLAFGDNEGTALLKTIKRIYSNGTQVVVTYNPTPHIDEKMAVALRRLQPWLDEKGGADDAAIRYHYLQLCNHYEGRVTIPLALPLSSSLTLAASRTTAGETGTMENRAALLALAIFFGTERFNTLINAIEDDILKECRYNIPKITLAGRKDLALHFIYSAAIKILIDSRTSFAVGELKEMLDALQGGSGFSFADLAADHSGIRFAELASSPQSARQLQRIATELLDEHRFFPDISGLPEAISQQQFEQQYGGTSGDYYNQQIEEIKGRIDAVALYRLVQ